jgi:hypothetical protein
MIALDTYWLTIAISVVLPAIVALVTKQTASGTVKSLTLLLLSAITAAAVQIQQAGGTFDWQLTLRDTIVSFVIAVSVHFGLLKSTGLTGSNGAIQTRVSGGIG